MGKRPKLEALDVLFDSGRNFELTDEQYEKRTGVMLPKRTYYLVNSSALARRAKEKGYNLEVVEKSVIFTKIKERIK